MALALDASTPAAFSTGSGTVITSASFSPPVGSLLVVASSWDTSSTPRTATVTNTGTATVTAWTKAVDHNTTQGVSSISWARVTGAGTVTVTVTYSGGATDGIARCMVWTGADPTTPTANGATIVATAGSNVISWTTAAAGSKLILVYANESNNTLPAVALMTTAASQTVSAAEYIGYQTGTTTSGSNSVTLTGATAGAPMARLEVVVAPTGPTADVAASSTFSATVTAQTGNSVLRTQTFAATVAASKNTPGGATLAASFASTVAASLSRVAASTPITCALEVELTPSTWTDVTQYVSYRSGPVTIRQGRPTEYDDIAGGVMSFALWNDDGRFMPGNMGSPLYPAWGKGKRVRWTVTKDGTTYTRFLGWIQAIAPEYPGTSTVDAIVQVTATDALGLLAQRKLRSNFTETMLWRARLDACAVDSYEAFGQTSGLYAYLTNYSNDTARQTPSTATNATLPNLSFTSDQDMSIGGVVNVPEAVTCNKTLCNFQANHLQHIVHVKLPSEQISLPSGVTRKNIGTWHNTLFGGSSVAHLFIEQSGSNNALVLRNGANTATLGTFTTSAPFGQWVRIDAISDSGSPALSDWIVIYSDGTQTLLNNMSVDVRTIRAFEIPGAWVNFQAASFGGVASLGTRTSIDWEESWVGATRTLDLRIDHLTETLAAMPITLSTVGTTAGLNVATGDWSGRTAAEVAQEMMRTHSGLVWAASGTEFVLLLASDVLYPAAVTATIDVDGDCLGTPRLVDGTEAQPTRVDAEWGGGVATVRDATAEASGFIRSRRITTVAASLSGAQGAAQAMLNRAVGGLRISQLELDLMGAAHDLAPLVLAETPDYGLYPTVRYRVRVPVSHFGVTTRDVHVQGWTERYDPGRASITIDTSPAIESLYALQTWTGSNGAAWPAGFTTGFGAGVGSATFDIQGNRGRILNGAGTTAGRRDASWTAADVEITGLVQVTGTAEAQVWWRLGAGSFTNGYALVFSVSDGVRVQQLVGGSIATRYTAAQVGGPAIVAGTDYRFRIRHQGDALLIRAWAASGAEPGTWGVNALDDLHTAAGNVGLAQWYPSQSCLFDDITVTTGA